ncbi:MAG: metal-dependent transcriptional regulator [Planctomycetaceae bacterium]|nr:metal-dependent transcriptional regulator [Planctomycetaceae bacterium]
MPSLTVENYIKAIYQIGVGQPSQTAATGQIASTLGVSPGSVTSMLKTLGESGLVTYTPYEGVQLTSSGNALALRVLRRHRLIELFLAKTLRLSWDEVHEEAEHMEHAVSDLLVDRIDDYLGHPEVDPHGDPIPRADGSVDVRDARPLVECNVGEKFRLARVIDQSPQFLRYLTDAGLTLGTSGEVLGNSSESETLEIRCLGKAITLGHTAAAKLLVTAVDER